MQTDEKTLARTEESEILKFFVAKINNVCRRKTPVSGRRRETTGKTDTVLHCPREVDVCSQKGFPTQRRVVCRVKRERESAARHYILAHKLRTLGWVHAGLWLSPRCISDAVGTHVSTSHSKIERVEY